MKLNKLFWNGNEIHIDLNNHILATAHKNAVSMWQSGFNFVTKVSLKFT